FFRAVEPCDDQRGLPLRRIVADESEKLAVRRKRNRAVNIRFYLARRAAEQRDLMELVGSFTLPARHVVDEYVFKRTSHDFEDAFRRRDDLRGVRGDHLSDPQALHIAIFHHISDELSVMRNGREQGLA